MKDKGKLKPLTFLYGFGAAVVLVGAMFKFLGWNYANQMFVVGLSIEARCFNIGISAIKRCVNVLKSSALLLDADTTNMLR